MTRHSIEVNNQTALSLDFDQLRRILRIVLGDAGYSDAEVSVAVVSDDRMQELNRRHLDHDYATDVLSFRLDDQEEQHRLEGEIIVSADTAARESARYGWSMQDELLLYVLHGGLHLVGYDDAEETDRLQMREAESRYLGQLDERLGAQHALGLRNSPLSNHQD